MKKINISEFYEQFKKEYDFLYSHKNVAGYDEAVNFFDSFINAHPELVAEFVNFRGDFIASDREAAAFSFALEAMGALD